MSHGETPPGLRERKHRRTSLAIQRAAAELTLEGGYQGATISRIAERADVSPRTVSTYFPGKDDIFFVHVPELIGRLEAHLAGGRGSTVDRMEQWIQGETERADEAQRAGEFEENQELSELQHQAVKADPELRAKEGQMLEPMVDALARAFAVETGQSPSDVGPRFFAGATFGVFMELRSRIAGDPPITLDDVHQALNFLRAGAPALAQRSPASA